MNEKLILLKIRLELAKLQINESYRASNYLAEIILEMILQGDDSKSCYLMASNKVEQKFNIAHSSVVLGISNLLRESKFAENEDFKNLNIYKKIRFVKNYIVRAMQ